MSSSFISSPPANPDSSWGLHRKHLGISTEDRDNKLLTWFTNHKQYRLSPQDPEFVSAMQKNDYVLTSTDNESTLPLVIDDDILKKPSVEATKQLNILVDNIKSYFGAREQKKRFSFSLNKSLASSFATVEEPLEAKRVRADIVSLTGER